jgi:hypothetical protein
MSPLSVSLFGCLNLGNETVRVFSAGPLLSGTVLRKDASSRFLTTDRRLTTSSEGVKRERQANTSSKFVRSCLTPLLDASA